MNSAQINKHKRQHTFQQCSTILSIFLNDWCVYSIMISYMFVCRYIYAKLSTSFAWMHPYKKLFIVYLSFRATQILHPNTVFNVVTAYSFGIWKQLFCLIQHTFLQSIVVFGLFTQLHYTCWTVCCQLLLLFGLYFFFFFKLQVYLFLCCIFFWTMADHNEILKSDIKWNGKQCMNYCASNLLAINICWEITEKNGPEIECVCKNPYHNTIYFNLFLHKMFHFLQFFQLRMITSFSYGSEQKSRGTQIKDIWISTKHMHIHTLIVQSHQIKTIFKLNYHIANEYEIPEWNSIYMLNSAIMLT